MGANSSDGRGLVAKYEHISVRLVDEDGNAFAILGKVAKALRRGGVSENIIEAFRNEATDGDYDHLLQVVMEWVNVERCLDDEEEG